MKRDNFSILLQRLIRAHQERDSSPLSPDTRERLIQTISLQQSESRCLRREGEPIELSQEARLELLNRISVPQSVEANKQQDVLLTRLKLSYQEKGAEQALSTNSRDTLLRRIRNLREPKPVENWFFAQAWNVSAIAAPLALALFIHASSLQILPDFPIEKLLEVGVDF